MDRDPQLIFLAFLHHHAPPMHKIAFFSFTSALVSSIYVQLPVHVPFATLSVENLGFVGDPASNPDIFHDGGGGATQNGYHVQVFADSDTASNGFNFVHNSVAYYGLVTMRAPGEIRID
jgi:hypothetical protein